MPAPILRQSLQETRDLAEDLVDQARAQVEILSRVEKIADIENKVTGRPPRRQEQVCGDCPQGILHECLAGLPGEEAWQLSDRTEVDFRHGN